MPLLSVIIPSYNRLSTISVAIGSVLQQSGIDFEIVFVDDGSTDGTGKFLQDLNQPRIRYFSQARSGVSAARNLGIRESRGEWIMFLDSDDRFLPGYFEKVSPLFGETIDIIFVGVSILSGGVYKGTIMPSRPYGKPSNDGMFLAGMFMVRKQHLLSAGCYDEFLTYSENTELSWRLKPFLVKKFFLDVPLLEVNQSFSRPSASAGNLYLSFRRIIERHAAFMEANPPIHFLYLNNLGVASLRLSKVGEARIYFLRALGLRHYALTTWTRLFIAFLPPFLRDRIYPVI
jgi:glycosyltransferase involved in cell wall biosynthesis